MLSKFQNLPIKTSRSSSAMKILCENEHLEVELYHWKIHEKVTMDYSKSKEFWTLLEDFIDIQKNQLKYLKIRFDEHLEDVKKNRILGNLEDLLKCEIQRLVLEVLDISQAVSILKHLNPDFIDKLEIKINQFNGKIDSNDATFLMDWKKPRKLVYKMEKLCIKDMISINQLLLHWSLFTNIHLIFSDFQSDSWEFPTVPFEFQFHKTIGFLLTMKPDSSFYCAPSLVKLTLSNEKSSKVLECPVIMQRILDNLQLFDIQRLRKTCRGIRECVDQLKPDPMIQRYMIYVQSNKSICTYIVIEGDQYISVVNESFSRASSDFELHFKHQKSCLTELSLSFLYQSELADFTCRQLSEAETESLPSAKCEPFTSEFLEGLEKILKTRPEPLKVRKLDMAFVSSKQVMQVLPYLDPKSIEKLNIFDLYAMCYLDDWNVTELPEPCRFDLEEISKTEQWRNAKVAEIFSYSIRNPIQKMNWFHFRLLVLRVIDTITVEEVLYLKENLQKSSNLRSFNIHFKQFVGQENLHVHLGDPTEIATTHRTWEFPIHDSETTDEFRIILQSDNIYFGYE